MYSPLTLITLPGIRVLINLAMLLKAPAIRLALLIILLVKVSIDVSPDSVFIASSKPLPIASLDSSTATVNLAISPA